MHQKPFVGAAGEHTTLPILPSWSEWGDLPWQGSDIKWRTEMKWRKRKGKWKEKKGRKKGMKRTWSHTTSSP